MNVYSQGVTVTYAKAPPIEAAPASPILFDERNSACNVLFWLQNKLKTQFDNAPLSIRKKNRVAPKKWLDE